MFLRTFYIILFMAVISTESSKRWKSVEKLIEDNPYIVALLNLSFEYMCTGTAIGTSTILTSGTCVSLKPVQVAVGVAVVGKKIPKSNVIDVASTRLHGDYSFEMRGVERNVTRMHSNIGLVFVVRSILQLYNPVVEIGSYYASELQDIELMTVGYGPMHGTRNVVLQYTNYIQAPCANPRWYYCICGVADAKSLKTYEKSFGNGAPVFFGNEIVGITASASGILIIKATGLEYNVFTIIGPYIAWIERAGMNTTVPLHRVRSAAVRIQGCVLVKFIYLLLLINKICN